ncbi:hypothetical protein [Paraburkholderia fynbosensis]|uniref:Uncharacterized protein n=1 Tax=Paraburkholderia fynbosensis TaxID=1200993 RepID=A0A6J5G9N7_9BURK|nr:hypothetical protein [Paraburkholderia fynbosensis]CAB3794606.1 hypothetical protein LMG27177_03677 [Paraburkholderia fynbosensis]
MKSVVTHTILTTPVSWLHRAISRVEVPFAAEMLQLAVIASVCYFTAAVVAIGMAIVLANAGAMR